MARLLTELTSGRGLLMDGAMGSELYQAGLEPDECGEEWNLSRGERVRAIHESYVRAGARCLLTNTFQANPCALVRHGLEERLADIVSAGVRLARHAAGSKRFVLADIGPILISPEDHDFSDWDDLLRTASAFLNPEQGRADVDGILVETCSSPRSLTAVEMIRHRILEDADFPVLLSIAYHRHPDGSIRTHSGHAPETFARHAAGHGVAALGVNCGLDMGPGDVVEVLKRYRATTDLPLFARPNAGTPLRFEGRLVHPRDPAAMADRVRDMIEAGACMIGGCCGTTPAHIAAMKAALER